jgi:hypothetical protein
MIDLHLINVALAGIGAGVVAVLLIAAAIYAIAVFGPQRRASRRTHLAPASTVSVAGTTTVSDQKNQVREPALR